MGGSGSTGSSLLKNILNRHNEIFSGGETEFFAKKMIYENWTKARSRVLKRKLNGLRNHGWHIYNGVDLIQEEYLWERQELDALLKKSATLHEFTSSFFARAMNRKGANIWLEKTPSNAACFSFFLKSFQSGKVIHITRNPFDTIASLLNRGIDLYYATGIYLLNTACGIGVIESARSMTVKYEDLIHNSESTVRGICDFLNIEYTGEMLVPQGEVVNSPKLSGWKYDETKAIGKASIGRFNQCSDIEQNAILEAVNMIQINERGKGYYNTKIQNVHEICEELGYEFYEIGRSTTYSTLRSLQKKDRLKRITRGYPTGFYYPLEIRK